MYRLFINEEEAELNINSKIKLKRMVLDLKDLSKRGFRFTNAFTLQPSGVNLRLCGSPQLLGTNNNSFEKTYPYTLQDQNTIISQGRLIVKDYEEKKGIKIQLSEGVDFWSLADSRQLNDLDLHDQDFQFTTANMNAKKLRGANVFLTCLYDSRGDKTNTALTNYTFTRPMYVLRNVVDRLAAEFGYTIDYGDVLETTPLNLTGCLSNSRDFFVSDYKTRFQGAALVGDIGLASGTSQYNVGNNVTVSGTTINNGTYKTAFSIKRTVTSNLNTSILFKFADRTERVLIPKGTSFISFKTDTSDIGIDLIIEALELVTFDDVYINSVVSEGDIFDENEAYGLDNMYVLADYNLPLMTGKSLMKILMQQSFLQVNIDNQNKTLEFQRISSQLNTNNAIDLTDKITRNNSWGSGQLYGKLNWLGYTNDNDVDANIGRAYFSVSNENGQAVKPIIDIKEFSASNEVSVSGERIVQANIYDTVEVGRESVSDRIVYFNEVGAFGFNATFNELSFHRLYSDHYFNFIDGTKRERLVDFDVFLNYETFVRLQNNPLIYNSDLGGIFLVTEVTEYNEKELSKIKTVKYG